MSWENPAASSFSVPPPLPASAMEWRFQPRPTAITTIAILSIIFGSLGIILSGLGMLYAVVFGFLLPAVTVGPGTTTTTARVFYSPGISISSSTSTSSYQTKTVNAVPPIVTTGPRGLDEEQRHRVLDALHRAQPFGSLRRQRLDQLLAKAGQDMFPNAIAVTATDDSIAAAISDSGVSADVANPAGGRTAYFVVGQGRIEVDNAHASFTPSTVGGDANRGVVRVSDDDDDDNDPSAGLNATPATTVPAPTTFGSPITPVRAGPVSILTAGWLALAAEFCSLALAAILLTAGILAMRNSRRARAFHLVYAVLKLFAAVFVGLSWSWLLIGFFGTIAVKANTGGVSGTPTPAPAIMYLGTFLTAAGVCIYPVAVMIVFSLKSVRDYYRVDAEGRTF